MHEAKHTARNEVKASIRQQTPSEIIRSDSALFARFLALKEVHDAQNILLFWGMGGLEPDTIQLVATLTNMGKRISMPRMLAAHQMELPMYQIGAPYITTRFGIHEPAQSAPLMGKNEVEVALIPALCYDERGYRLGFGGGYYDRFLAEFSGVTVGLCRESLLRQEVPIEAHDSKVDILITEHTVRYISRQGYIQSLLC